MRSLWCYKMQVNKSFLKTNKIYIAFSSTIVSVNDRLHKMRRLSEVMRNGMWNVSVDMLA